MSLTWILTSVLMLWTISTFSSTTILLQILNHAFSAIAAQESLSGLETEMRKLEGLVKEVVDEMDYLKKREERFSSTNGTLDAFAFYLAS